MIIGVDANEANIEKRVGVNQYAYELLMAIYKRQEAGLDKNSYILYLREEPTKELPPARVGWDYKVLTGNSLWVFTKLTPYLLFNREIDLFFSPSHYLPLVFGIPKVFTIHDLGYLKFSEQFRPLDFWQLKLWTATSIFISKCIIAVSLFTKNDIVRHYKFASSKIKIVLHGLNHNNFNSKNIQDDVRRIKKQFHINGDYIIFLGTLKPSKNVVGLLRAFRIVVDSGYRIKLVIAGKRGWKYNEVYTKLKELDLEKNVIFTNYVSDEDKPILLKGSKVLVSPSYWEGFGMHILESLACGTPVVASRVASIPEICGDACVLTEPDDIVKIAEGIKYYLDMDNKRYNKEVEKGLKQAKKFSWDKCAKETINIFNQIS